MPDLEDFLLPDTFEELRGVQQQTQPTATTSAPGENIENLYNGRGKKENENLKIDTLTEVRVIRTETRLKPAAKTSPIQPRVMRMNQRLGRQSLQTTRHRTQNLEGTLTMNGKYIIVRCQKGISERYNLTIGN